MLKYLIVVLSDSSTSFCHYESAAPSQASRGLLPIDALRAAVLFALKNNLKVNILYPGRRPGRVYEDLIDGVDHVKIVPFRLRRAYRDALLVVESDAFPSLEELKTLRGENIILRARRIDLPRLSSRLGLLLPRAKRINVVWADLQDFGPEDLAEYRAQLENLSRKILGLSVGRTPPELNILTDRIVLRKMNNCDAGLTHLTVAPNGRLYICPAFFYRDADDTLGEIRNEIPIRNRRLLEAKYSPICRICDAYQCKRCVYLNKTMTLEINTPSSQQCLAAHVEREAARRHWSEIGKKAGNPPDMLAIPEIAYADPFEVVEKNKLSIAEFKKL